MTDILQRVVNMLGDCAIGPMRTLKTDDLTRVLYDAHEEIERLLAREARLREALQWYVDNDDTNEADPENAFWIEGRDRARAALGEEKK
jgi:hypothetical protein